MACPCRRRRLLAAVLLAAAALAPLSERVRHADSEVARARSDLADAERHLNLAERERRELTAEAVRIGDRSP